MLRATIRSGWMLPLHGKMMVLWISLRFLERRSEVVNIIVDKSFYLHYVDIIIRNSAHCEELHRGEDCAIAIFKGNSQLICPFSAEQRHLTNESRKLE